MTAAIGVGFLLIMTVSQRTEFDMHAPYSLTEHTLSIHIAKVTTAAKAPNSFLVLSAPTAPTAASAQV